MTCRQTPPAWKSFPRFTPTTGTVERRFSTNHKTPVSHHSLNRDKLGRGEKRLISLN
jgi:hypothetical protein